MADKVMRDFYQRVARIERAREQGLGLEAQGALGRSHYARNRRWRIPVAGPVLIVVAGVILLKAVVHAGLGTQEYEARAATLWAGGAVERVGAVVMQPDPVSAWLAGQIATAFR